MVFQSFRLMDGQDADSFDFSRRNGLFVQLFVPVSQESCQFRRMFLLVFRHGIIEGTQVGILMFDPLHAEKDEELFHQFIERHQLQFLQLQHEARGEIIGNLIDKNGVQADVLMQDLVLVGYGQTRLGNQIIGHGQKTQPVDDHADGQ